VGCYLGTAGSICVPSPHSLYDVTETLVVPQPTAAFHILQSKRTPRGVTAPSRTNWTRLVPPSVLTGHVSRRAASLRAKRPAEQGAPVVVRPGLARAGVLAVPGADAGVVVSGGDRRRHGAGHPQTWRCHGAGARGARGARRNAHPGPTLGTKSSPCRLQNAAIRGQLAAVAPYVKPSAAK